MSNIQAHSLEKTLWTFKHLIDQDLTNENIEIILNFSDKQKFEINMNKYHAHLY